MIELPKLKEVKIRGYRALDELPGRILKYKCLWLNKTFIQVNSYYPSSQICSRCGNKNEEMKDIRVRELKCSKCGLEIERDYNASINILNEGLKSYNN